MIDRPILTGVKRKINLKRVIVVIIIISLSIAISNLMVYYLTPSYGLPIILIASIIGGIMGGIASVIYVYIDSYNFFYPIRKSVKLVDRVHVIPKYAEHKENKE